jgi:hypothetical protein
MSRKKKKKGETIVLTSKEFDELALKLGREFLDVAIRFGKKVAAGKIKLPAECYVPYQCTENALVYYCTSYVDAYDCEGDVFRCGKVEDSGFVCRDADHSWDNFGCSADFVCKVNFQCEDFKCGLYDCQANYKCLDGEEFECEDNFSCDEHFACVGEFECENDYRQL